MIFFMINEGTFNFWAWHNIVGIILGVLVFLFSVFVAVTEAETEDGAAGYCAMGLFFGAITWIAFPLLIAASLIVLVIYGIYKLVEYVVKYKPKTKAETEIDIYPDANKYKTMLSDAVEAISKYHMNLSKTKLTPEGKSIVVAVGASIDKVSQIIKNSNSERITIDVFEKAYQAIKANRIELQRAEKLVSLGIEDQLEQEIKLMKATLPR